MYIKAVKFRKEGEVQQGVNGYQLSAVSYQLGSNDAES